MAKSTNIQNLESMLNEAQIEKEINSILEELGTNDAPEAVESGEADEKEFSAGKEDWFDKEENSDDVKEVIVEAEDAEEDDDSDKADKSEDDEEKDSKEDESEDDEKDSDDEDKEDEKSEDKEEDSLKEDEELSINDAPQAVEAGEADEKAFDADENDYFPGEENADDIASDKANSDNQLKEDEELSTNDAPQAVEAGSADEKEFSAGKEDWFDKEENSDDVKEVIVEQILSMNSDMVTFVINKLNESELILLSNVLEETQMLKEAEAPKTKHLTQEDRIKLLKKTKHKNEYSKLSNDLIKAKKDYLDTASIETEAKKRADDAKKDIEKEKEKRDIRNRNIKALEQDNKNNLHWYSIYSRIKNKNAINKFNKENDKSQTKLNDLETKSDENKQQELIKAERKQKITDSAQKLKNSKTQKIINHKLIKNFIDKSKKALKESCGFKSDNELIKFLEDCGFVYTDENFIKFCESYGISEDYVDENPELVDAQEAGFDDGEADETIVPAVAPDSEEDVVSESFSSIFSILDSINEELSTNDAPQAVESGEADEESFDASEDEVFEGEEEADDVKEVVTESEDKEEESDEDDSKEDEKSEDDEKDSDDEDKEEESDEDDDKEDEKSEDEAIKEDAQGQGETSEDKQFDVDATLASDAAAEIGTEENQEDIKDQEEECDSCKNESYSSFEEAISLGAEYFAEEEHKNRLIEQVALSIANENGDRLFKEMVEATVLATRLQEAIIAKYNRTATARVQNLIEDMELSTNDAPQAVEAGKADEKAFDADEKDYFPGEENADDIASDKANSDNQLKEDEELGVNDAPEAVSSANPDEKAFDADEKDYFPGEENADDIASDKANSDNQLKEDEELGTNDAPQAVEAGEADEESFDASEDEVFDDEDADDVGEVVVESFTDDMIMDFLTESEMFDATENNVRKIRNAINEGTISNFYNGELNEDMNNWYHEKKINTLVKKIEKLKLKIANEKDPYKKDKLQAKYEKLVQRLDYHKNAYIPEKKSASVNESVRKPRIATTASEKNNK